MSCGWSKAQHNASKHSGLFMYFFFFFFFRGAAMWVCLSMTEPHTNLTINDFWAAQAILSSFHFQRIFAQNSFFTFAFFFLFLSFLNVSSHYEFLQYFFSHKNFFHLNLFVCLFVWVFFFICCFWHFCIFAPSCVWSKEQHNTTKHSSFLFFLFWQKPVVKLSHWGRLDLIWGGKLESWQKSNQTTTPNTNTKCTWKILLWALVWVYWYCHNESDQDVNS